MKSVKPNQAKRQELSRSGFYALLNQIEQIDRKSLKRFVQISIIGLLLFAGHDLTAQEKIYAIDAFQEQEVKAPVAQVRTMVANKTSQASQTSVLGTDKIAEFRNLYYNVQPVIYYNSDGIVNATEGSRPAVIYVAPNAFSHLQRDAYDAKNEDFSTVKLLVVEGEVTGTLPAFFVEKFPELEFLLFKNEAGKPAINTVSTANRIPNEFWEKHQEVIVIYNNLQSGN